MKIQTSLISHVVSAVVGLALSAVLLNAGQLSATQTAKPHPTPHPRPTPTGTPSATPTASPSTTPIVTPTPIPTPPDNTFLTGLYAYYELDEASGAAMDSYGTRTLANFGNPVGTAAGKINTSRNFPGGNAYFCSLNTTDFSPGSNHFFFSLWAKAGNLTQGQSDTGLLSKTGTANNKQWILFYKNRTRKPTLAVSLNDANGFSVVATTAFADTTTWYFIAGGWDGTNIKISVNGGPYATTAFAGPVAPTGNIPFTIGLEIGSGGGWLGQIDEVAIWIGRNDLSISEVQQLYNNGAGLPFSSFH
jgi:Concanavalin A-like lectin/glucanases superfamily